MLSPMTVTLSGAPLRLVATDLDGTLLRSDGTISERTRALLGSLIAQGIPVVMVSARSPHDLRRIADYLGIDGIGIASNGAMVVELATTTILDHWQLSSEVATRLVIALRRVLPEAYFAIESGLRAGWECGYLEIRGRAPEPGDWIDDALVLCSAPVSKLLMRHPTLSADEMLAIGREIAGDDAVATHSGARLLELSAVGVDKGLALAALCARLDIAPSNVAAFGDMPNDIPMLRWAGCGVAVANAHAEVLSVADAVTASNDDDGLAVALEALLARQSDILS
jgi:hydroxymethylpyrimidine pyrophosphatase-like HAD family hydrolase